MGVEPSAPVVMSSHSSEGWDASYKTHKDVNEFISDAD